MARCQAFYKAVFGWEFNSPPNSPEGAYAMFSKPNTKLSGGLYHVKEENVIQPKVDEKGNGQATNRIVLKVEEVDAALKNIEAAGGKIITQVPFLCEYNMSDAFYPAERRPLEAIWATMEVSVIRRETSMVYGPRTRHIYRVVDRSKVKILILYNYWFCV